MIEFEIWPVKLNAREEHIILGGTKQCKARALFCAMLPDDGSCWQAAEVVKRALPHENQLDAYQEHRKALYDLANANDLKTTPDNVDEFGHLLAGKRPGSFQRPKWNARSWQQIISDEIWQWVLDFMFDLQTREASAFILYGQKVRFFCNLQTFEVREMYDSQAMDDWGLWDLEDDELIAAHHKTSFFPSMVSPDAFVKVSGELTAILKRKEQEWKRNQAPALRSEDAMDLDAQEPDRFLPNCLTAFPSGPEYLGASLFSAATVFVVIFMLWPTHESTKSETVLLESTDFKGVLTTQEMELDYDEYVLATKKPSQIYAGPLPPKNSEWAATWKADSTTHEIIVAKLPTMFLVDVEIPDS